MDKVNPNDLARLIGSLEDYAKIAKPESQWMPQTVFALLDELERAAERNVAIGAELEQYRKDAERLNLLADHVVIEGFVGVEKDIYDISCEVAESNGREEPSDDDQRQALRLLIDAFCAKEVGAHG